MELYSTSEKEDIHAQRESQCRNRALRALMNHALRAMKNRRPDGTGFSFALSTKASSATLVAGMTSSPKCQSAGVPTWQFNCNWWCLIWFAMGKRKKMLIMLIMLHLIAISVPPVHSGWCAGNQSPSRLQRSFCQLWPGRGLWGGSVCPGLCQAREILLPATNVNNTEYRWIPIVGLPRRITPCLSRKGRVRASQFCQRCRFPKGPQLQEWMCWVCNL